MSDRISRVFAGLCVLSGVWIGVYWLADGPVAPRVTFDPSFGEEAEPASDSIPLAAVERVQPPGPPAPEMEPLPEQGSPAARSQPESRGVVPPGYRDYTIREGDTFQVVSTRIYGSPGHASAIARANPFVDPTRLKPGRVIRVPTDPTNIQGKPVTREGERGAAANAGTPTVVEYVVKPGDTLSAIATAFYGKPGMSGTIFEANRDRLTSEDSLRVGQTLRIPNPTGPAGGR